jgi:hypothetical protein
VSGIPARRKHRTRSRENAASAGDVTMHFGIPLLGPGRNGVIVFPVEAALNFAPQAGKRRVKK